MLTICTNFREISKTISLSERFEEVFFAAGVHPNQPSECFKFESEDLLSLCDHKKMIGVGETGLDFHYSEGSKKDQIKSLIQHIEVAKEANLPVIIHARNADEEIGKILSEQYHKSAFDCVMHCFSSSSYLAEKAIELGFYLSMSGIITFKNSQSLRDIFSKVPIEKILVETDSPYLAPVPCRGKSNEPAFVSFIAKKGADILDVDEEFFRTQTTKNFFTLFKKAF
jgi:TatD DNase family protein